MSAPRIKVVWSAEDGEPPAVWWCMAARCWRGSAAEGEALTIAAASDAGRAHLAAHHTVQMPPVAHGDPDGPNVAQNRAAQAPSPYSAALDTAHNEGVRR